MADDRLRIIFNVIDHGSWTDWAYSVCEELGRFDKKLGMHLKFFSEILMHVMEIPDELRPE